MSTKLNAEELAAKHHRYYARRESYAAAIREHSQPLADKLDAVTRERDELREALGVLMSHVTQSHLCHPNCVEYASAILAKYPKQ
jgi:hypothetical protein